jgi:hypothetical protein
MWSTQFVALVHNSIFLKKKFQKAQRPLGKPIHRWKDTIQTDLKEILCKDWNGFVWLKIEFGGRLL